MDEMPFRFEVIRENVNAINFHEFFDYPTYHELLDKAIEVKNLSVFQDIEIPNYEKFIPFPYQIDSVKTMLEKYEGKGVFGDQVGLGKTVQTLMTAHVMFLSNEIKNMVIIAPKVLVDQWKSEIENKFQGLFHVVNHEGVTNKMEHLNLLSNPDYCSDSKLNILFIDTNAFKEKQVVYDDKKKFDDIQALQRSIDTSKKNVERLQNEIEGLKNDPKIIKEVKLYRFAGDDLDTAYTKIKQISERMQQIDYFERDIDESNKKIDKIQKDRLFNRQIDLLVIDESHSVIDSINESDFASIFYELGKKYCVLLSATPIERSLDDIYYLIKFVAGNRFATLEDFHRYVDAKSLSELVSNEKSKERLNGLINSLFTRKRLRDSYVIRSLSPKTDLTQFADFIDKKIDRLSNMEGMSEDEISSFRDRVSKSIEEYSLPFRRFLKAEGKAIPCSNYIEFDLQELLNMYLIKYYLATNDRLVYPFISWAPSSRGVQFHYAKQEDRTPYKVDEISKVVLDEIMDNILTKFSRMVIYCLGVDARYKMFQAISKEYPKRKILLDISIPAMQQMVRDYSFLPNRYSAMLQDRVFPYMHLDSKDERELLDFVLITEKKGGSKVVEDINLFYKNFILDQFHSDPEGNAVFIVDRTRLEGSDLHAASNFILCQTHTYDNATKARPIIMPLSLEQFIGRVYRIGQTANVDIHVFPSNAKEGYLFDSVYSDAEGLDLFGEERIETGFVVPIIVDTLKKKLGLGFENFGFAELYSYYYDQLRMGEFIDVTRNVCKQFRIGEKEGK